MSFRDDLARFAAKAEARARALHARVSELAFSSIVEGSPVTGAPGQPVDTGALRASWELVPIAPLAAAIVTNLVYAPIIEDGIGPHGPIQIRSQVGGTHSVKLTRAGWSRIVEQATREVAGA